MHPLNNKIHCVTIEFVEILPNAIQRTRVTILSKFTMGNRHSKILKKEDQKNKQVPSNFFYWVYTSDHERSLTKVLKQYNLESTAPIIKSYVSNHSNAIINISGNGSAPVFCHASILEKHSFTISDKWLLRQPTILKVLMLGDGGVGKQFLCRRWITGAFLVDFDPTIEIAETKTFDLSFDRVNHAKPKCITLEPIDRMGCEDYVESRKKHMREANIFLICFEARRAISKYGFNLRKCINEILREIEVYRDEKDNFGLLLVGTKCDWKKQENEKYECMDTIVNEYDLPYIETSSKENINVDLLFKLAVYEYWIQTDIISKTTTVN